MDFLTEVSGPQQIITFPILSLMVYVIISFT